MSDTGQVNILPPDKPLSPDVIVRQLDLGSTPSRPTEPLLHQVESTTGCKSKFF